MNVLVIMGKNKPGMLRTILGVDRALLGKGFNFYYFLSNDKYMDGLDFNRRNIETIGYMSSLRSFPGVVLGGLIGLLKGKNALKRWDIDIIYNYTLSTLPFCLLLSKISGIPYLAGVRNAYEGDGKRYRKYLLHYAKNILAVSQDTMNCVEQMLGENTDKANRYLAYNGIDTKYFDSFEHAGRPEEFSQFSDKDLIVGMVAAMNPEKDPQFLLKIAGKIVYKYPNVKFVFIGGFHDSSYEKETMDLLKKLSLENNAFFLGIKNPVQAYFFHMDILVHPTWRKEAFGLVLAEAMYYKKPIVASRIGGIPEIVEDNNTGILCEPGNEEEFTEALERLISDNQLRSRMGEKGKKRVNALFSMDSLSGSLAAIFKKIVN